MPRFGGMGGAFGHMGAGGIVPTSAAVAAATTWNPSDKNAALSLGAGNLVVTNSAVESYKAVRATNSASSGKKYYEFVYNVLTKTPGDESVGIANATQSLSNYLGITVNGIGWFDNGTVISNDVVLATVEAYIASDVLGVAVDFGNSKIWFRKNGGNWNNDAAANPATNTNGISIAGMAAGPYFPATNLFKANNAGTVNFGASSYAQTPPVGFGNW